MKFSQLARLFQEWGYEIRHEHYVAFSDYLRDMLKMNRVLVVRKEEEILAILTYYLTNDYESLYKKPTWQIAQDNELGHQLYIDKMVCKKFTKQIHKLIEEAVIEKYPNVEIAIYHKAPADRCIKIPIRRHACTV